MIFEKNPFTTAVSIPKSFHMTSEAPTLKNIDQPYVGSVKFLYKTQSILKSTVSEGFRYTVRTNNATQTK